MPEQTMAAAAARRVPWWTWLLVSAGVIGLDQLSKWLVQKALVLGESILVLPFFDLVRGISARDRAIEHFSRLRIWDTEQNAGVLVYLLLADRRVEIVADRGIHVRVGSAAWETICGAMQRDFAAGRFEPGVITGIQAISDLLALHFPPRDDNPDELSNRPVVLD